MLHAVGVLRAPSIGPWGSRLEVMPSVIPSISSPPAPWRPTCSRPLASWPHSRGSPDCRTFLPSRANNLYIFPAVGMAIYATHAKRVTGEMFIEAVHAMADEVTPEQLKLGMLFPP
jgi:hypothetical protein